MKPIWQQHDIRYVLAATIDNWHASHLKLCLNTSNVLFNQHTGHQHTDPTCDPVEPPAGLGGGGAAGGGAPGCAAAAEPGAEGLKE